MLEGTEARDEIWHGDTVARGHGMLGSMGARMACRARNLSDSFFAVSVTNNQFQQLMVVFVRLDSIEH